MRSHCRYEPVLSGAFREKLAVVQTVKTLLRDFRF